MNIDVMNKDTMARLVEVLRNAASQDSTDPVYKEAAMLIAFTNSGKMIGGPITAANQFPPEILQQAQYNPEIMQEPSRGLYILTGLEKLLIIAGASVASTIQYGMADQSILLLTNEPTKEQVRLLGNFVTGMKLHTVIVDQEWNADYVQKLRESDPDRYAAHVYESAEANERLRRTYALKYVEWSTESKEFTEVSSQVRKSETK